MSTGVGPSDSSSLPNVLPPKVTDPFGPDFKLECPIAAECPEKILAWGFFRCNKVAELRIQAIDKVCTVLKAASIEKKKVYWIREDMSIDWQKMCKTRMFNSSEKHILEQKLLTDEGYFKLNDLHGGCTADMDAHFFANLENSRPFFDNLENSSALCFMCRAPTDFFIDRDNDLEKPMFIQSEYINQKLQGKFHLDLNGICGENPAPDDGDGVAPSPQIETQDSSTFKTIATFALGCIVVAGLAWVTFKVVTIMKKNAQPQRIEPQLLPYQPAGYKGVDVSQWH